MHCKISCKTCSKKTVKRSARHGNPSLNVRWNPAANILNCSKCQIREESCYPSVGRCLAKMNTSSQKGTKDPCVFLRWASKHLTKYTKSAAATELGIIVWSLCQKLTDGFCQPEWVKRPNASRRDMFCGISRPLQVLKCHPSCNIDGVVSLSLSPEATWYETIEMPCSLTWTCPSVSLACGRISTSKASKSQEVVRVGDDQGFREMKISERSPEKKATLQSVIL